MLLKIASICVHAYIAKLPVLDYHRCICITLMILINICTLLNYYLAPTLSFKLSTYIINESDELVELVLLLSNPSSTDITLQVLTTDGSATGKNNVLL